MNIVCGLLKAYGNLKPVKILKTKYKAIFMTSNVDSIVLYILFLIFSQVLSYHMPSVNHIQYS
jgi:hypothetical protein